MKATEPGSALDRVLYGLFDYAGMYPPASLSFEEALRTAAAFPGSLARPGLVSCEAVVPEARLANLTPELLAASGFQPGRSLRVAVLGPALRLDGTDPGAVPAAVLERSALRAGDPVPQRMASYEVRLAVPPDRAAAARPTLAALQAGLGESGLRLFVEPEWGPGDWEQGLVPLAAMLSDLSRDLPPLAGAQASPGRDLAGVNSGVGSRRVGLKVRGSGPNAVTAPALAAVLEVVAAANLPFKATAGLHHPLPEPGRYGNALGFLSLVMALRLAQALGPGAFPQGLIAECLLEEDPAAFRFDPRQASWRGRSVLAEQLPALARRVPCSIGSCSIAEPDADLLRLFPGDAPGRE